MLNKSKTVLITGVAGFIGRNAAKFFNRKGWKVIGTSLEKLKKEDYKKMGVEEYYCGKITKNLLLRIKVTPDLIIHCAGSGSVSLSLEKPKEDFEMNVGSLLEVLEFMRLKKSVARLVYPSSAAVYGQKNNSPIKESGSLNPVSPYGFHKKIAEDICESYSKNFNLNISIVRFFSVYGNDIQKQLLWDACKKILGAKKEVIFFGTGEETRDWIHVNDVGNLFLSLKKSKNRFEILNGASGKSTTIKKTLEIVLKEYGKSLKIIFNHVTKKGDPKYYWGDINKASALGWKPKVKLAEGIKSFVNNFKKNNG